MNASTITASRASLTFREPSRHGRDLEQRPSARRAREPDADRVHTTGRHTRSMAPRLASLPQPASSSNLMLSVAHNPWAKDGEQIKSAAAVAARSGRVRRRATHGATPE